MLNDIERRRYRWLIEDDNVGWFEYVMLVIIVCMVVWLGIRL